MVSPAMAMKIAKISSKFKGMIGPPGKSPPTGLMIGPSKRKSEHLIAHSIVCVTLIIGSWLLGYFLNFDIICPDRMVNFPLTHVFNSNGTWKPSIDTYYYKEKWDSLPVPHQMYTFSDSPKPVPGVDNTVSPFAYYGTISNLIDTRDFTIELNSVSRYYGGYTCVKSRYYYVWKCSCTAPAGFPTPTCECVRADSCCRLVKSDTEYNSPSYVDSTCSRNSGDYREEIEMTVTDSENQVIYDNASTSGDFYKSRFVSAVTVKWAIVGVPRDEGITYYASTLKPVDNPPTFVMGTTLDLSSDPATSGIILKDLGAIKSQSGINLREIASGLYRAQSPIGTLGLNNFVKPCEITTARCTRSDIEEYLELVNDGGNLPMSDELYEYKLALDRQRSLVSDEINSLQEEYERYGQEMSQFHDEIQSKEDSFLRLGYIGWVFRPPTPPLLPNISSFPDEILSDYPDLPNISGVPPCFFAPIDDSECAGIASNNVSAEFDQDTTALSSMEDVVKPLLSYLSVASLVSQVIWVLVLCIPTQLSAKRTKTQKALGILRSFGLTLALVTPTIVFLSFPGVFSGFLNIGPIDISQFSAISRLLCTPSKEDHLTYHDCMSSCSEKSDEWMTNVTSGCDIWLGLPISYPEKYNFCSISRVSLNECMSGCNMYVTNLIEISDIYYILKKGWPGFLLDTLPVVLISIIDTFWFSGWISQVKRGHVIADMSELKSSVRREWLIRNMATYMSLSLSLSIMSYSYFNSLLTFVAVTVSCVLIVLVLLLLLSFAASRNSWLRHGGRVIPDF